MADAKAMAAALQSVVRSARDGLPYFVGVACLYGVASLPGHALLIPNVYIAPIRLSAGAAIAALLLAPRRSWWWVLLALVPAHAVAGDPANRYVVALQYLAANAAEAIVAALLVRQVIGGRPRLDNLKACVTLLVACVVIGPLAGATIGAPSIIRRELTVSAFSTWEIWALADAAGNLVVVPLCLVAADLFARLRARMAPRVSAARVVEAIVSWAGILLTTAPGLGQAALGRRAQLSMLYAPFPFLVWASVRFGPPGAAVANLTLMTVTILYALTSQAPFGQPWDLNSVLETQQFLIVAGVTSITLGTLAAERWRARDIARENDERLQMSLHAGRIATWVWNFETNSLVLSTELARMIGVDPRDVEALARDFNAIDRIIYPADLAQVREDMIALRLGATEERATRFRVIRPDGSAEWVKVSRDSPADSEVSGEFRAIRRDGTFMWCEGHGRMLRDADGVPNRAIGLVIDISERKALDRERWHTTKALMELARSSFGDRGEIEEALRETTATAAETLQVERAGVWLFSSDERQLRCVCLYELTPARHSSGDELAVDRFPEYFQAVRDRRALAVEDTSTDPRTRELAAAHRALGIRSMLDAPLYVGGRLVGVFSFQHIGPPREWSRPAQNFASSMTDLLSRAFEAVERRKAEERLKRAYDQLRTLARRLEAAKEDERRSIAREIHDELGQSMTAIVIGLHLIGHDDREGRHAARLTETVALAERLIDRVRAISLNLRPPLLDELGLATALRGYLEGQAQQSGLDIAFEVTPPDLRIAPELEIGAFRIVQECLTNVIRHAAARRVTVCVTARDGQLLIDVDDDGRGFDVAGTLDASARGQHLGLPGMQERVMVLGGQVEFLSSAGRGTRVAARLPL